MHLRILSTIALLVESEIKLERHRREEFLDEDENLQDRAGGLQRPFSPPSPKCCKGAARGGLFKVFGHLAKSFFEMRNRLTECLHQLYSYHASHRRKIELLRCWRCLCFLHQEQMKTDLADVHFLQAMDGFGSQVSENLQGIEMSKVKSRRVFCFFFHNLSELLHPSSSLSKCVSLWIFYMAKGQLQRDFRVGFLCFLSLVQDFSNDPNFVEEFLSLDTLFTSEVVSSLVVGP